MDVARQLVAVTLVMAMLGVALWAARRGTAAPGAAGRAGGLPAARLSPLASRLAAGLTGKLPTGFTARFKGPASAMERVGRLVLTPQHALHLVRIQGQELVVATHPQGCSVVHTCAVGCETHSETGPSA